LKKLMMLMAMVTLVAAAAAPAALAQEASVSPDVNSGIDPNGVAMAKAGGTAAVAGCPDVPPEAKSGDVVAKAPCKPAPPPPPPPAPKAAPPAPAPAPAPKELPPTGGAGTASLLGLGAGALLVGGGLLVRRIVK
jgi:LPXTG-motif cell wall-anchored protein